MLTNDFRGLISLNPLGARIPTLYVTFGIQHKNRIVLYRFDENPESLFTAQVYIRDLYRGAFLKN
jgi:hypothetical protein